MTSRRSFLRSRCAPLFAMIIVTLSNSCAPLLELFVVPDASTPTVTKVPFSGTFRYTIDPGPTPKDVIFIFTGKKDASIASPGTTITVDDTVLPPVGSPLMPAGILDPVTAEDTIAKGRIDPDWLKTFAAGRPSMKLSSTPSYSVADTVGLQSSLRDPIAEIFVTATCRKIVSSVPVESDGTVRTLNIWVADDCWTGTGTEFLSSPMGFIPGLPKRHLVTQAMVDQMADRFLQSGNDNDIYDWMTEIFGPEFGPSNFSDWIAHDTNITILLTDILDSNGYNSDSGGIVGYYSPGNNYKASAYSYSNERIMFVMDAVMYANPDQNGYSSIDAGYYTGGPWSVNSYWAQELYATLAHEFQHMIQFYQKSVASGTEGSNDTWIDEMCSLLSEDLLSSKMQVDGPRGVAYNDFSAGSSGNTSGRIPVYNAYTYLPLIQTRSFPLTAYSVSYAFGAWLARNYGGAALINEIAGNPYKDERAITTAVKTVSGTSSTFDELLERWAAAIIGSDSLTMPNGFRLNQGPVAFESTVGTTTFSLGSINFFNFPSKELYTGTWGSPGPKLYKPGTKTPTGFDNSSTVYFLAAENLSSKKTFSISIPTGVGMQVYLK